MLGGALKLRIRLDNTPPPGRKLWTLHHHSLYVSNLDDVMTYSILHLSGKFLTCPYQITNFPSGLLNCLYLVSNVLLKGDSLTTILCILLMDEK